MPSINMTRSRILNMEWWDDWILFMSFCWLIHIATQDCLGGVIYGGLASGGVFVSRFHGWWSARVWPNAVSRTAQLADHVEVKQGRRKKIVSSFKSLSRARWPSQSLPQVHVELQP